MQGARQHATADDVVAFWHRFAEVEGFIDPESGLRAPGSPIVGDDRPLVAYVSDCRWVALCVECGGGVAAWPENPQGCCLDCGHLYTLTFPDAETIAAATVALEARLDRQTRNWRPDMGETAADLEAENEAHLTPAPEPQPLIEPANPAALIEISASVDAPVGS